MIMQKNGANPDALDYLTLLDSRKGAVKEYLKNYSKEVKIPNLLLLFTTRVP